jgi:hypothetical protein
MIRPIIQPRKPLGQRDWRAMNSGRRTAGLSRLISKYAAQTEYVGHARTEDRGGEAEGEVVDPCDAASRDDDTVPDQDRGHDEAN